MSEWEQGDRDAHLFLQKDIEQVVSSARAFAALKKNGKVMSWGDPQYAGIAKRTPPHPVTPFLKEIKTLYSSTSSFCALKTDNETAVRWQQNYHIVLNDISKIEQESRAGRAKSIKIHYKNGRV